jgi:hypothetical protein
MRKAAAMNIARRAFTRILIAVAMLWAGQSIGAQSSEIFRARLSVVPIDAAMKATIAGSGSVTATLAGNKLTINGTFEGLRSSATEAHIHVGPKGIRGPAILDLTISKATSGTISGSLELTPAQVADLKNSRLYVQIHSERAPDGNLWGWLLQ